MKTTRHILSIVLTLIITLNAAGAAYTINNVTVDSADVNSSKNDCWNYANATYKKIWGVNFGNSFEESSNYLRNLGDNDLTLTPEHLKAYVSGAALGAVLRICNDEWLHSTDGWGHSQIIVQKDENGFTVFEGGLSYPPYRQEKYYTWSEYCTTGWLGGTYRYIKYIKWPGAHTYNGPSSGSPAPAGLSVTKFVNCRSVITLPARVIDLYANITDTSRFTYFSYGPTVDSPVYAVMNDGSKHYKVTANHKGQQTDLWFQESNDMSITIEHTFGDILHESPHPHRCYQVCECGEKRYTGGNTQVESCDSCKISSIRFAPKNYMMTIGQKEEIKAEVSPSSVEVTYKSSNPNVATVDSNGTVTGVREGEADITASAGDKSATCHIEVETVYDLSFKMPSISLEVGQKKSMLVEISSSESTIGPIHSGYIVWNDSNPGIVSIAEHQNIIGLKPGKTTLTATCGGKSAKLDVEVTEPGQVHFKKTNTYSRGQFKDIADNQWFTDNVASAYEYNLMKGNGTTTFNPYGDVTVAEAITMAARIYSIYTTGTENFTQASPWYQVYLDYAYQNKVISRAFYNCDVRQKASRAHFAEIFANALSEEGLRAINNIPDNAIPDVNSSKDYAAAVYKLYRAGILTGSDAHGTFSPDSYITRAEAATIVSRMAESNLRGRFTI